jgi:hypothetical protein
MISGGNRNPLYDEPAASRSSIRPTSPSRLTNQTVPTGDPYTTPRPRWSLRLRIDSEIIRCRAAHQLDSARQKNSCHILIESCHIYFVTEAGDADRSNRHGGFQRANPRTRPV